MKLRNIFTILAAALAFAFVGCQEEERFLDEVKVSQSFVSIPVEGGSTEITVNAADDWAIAGVPEWLTVSPASGAAGETKVTFSAAKTSATNEAILELNCVGKTQLLTVYQMAEKVEVPLSTCKEVINGVDGVNYRVKGTVTSIANTQYGNWYLQDETGTVYVYGTLYEGAEKQFDKLGIEVGDIVTVEGPRKDYSGTIELVNVTVIEIVKSLIKVDEVSPEDATLPIEGGEFSVTLTAKGDGVTVQVPQAAQSWLSVTGVNYAGTTATVTFSAAANNGGDREVDLTFVTTSKGAQYTAATTLKQKGAIIECSVKDFLAAEVGSTLYRLTGKVEKLANTTYGNFNITDATGSVYVYGLTGNGAIGSNDKSFASLGIKEGDVDTIVGTSAAYNGTAQVGGTAYLVSHIGHTESTIADFLAQPVASDKWYKLTGKVANVKSDVYGNFDIVDETGSVYVYGLTVAPVAKNDKSYASLGINEGDVVTIVGTRAAYNGQDQVGGPAYYISHEAAGAEPEQPETPAEPETPAASTVTLTNAEICAMMTSEETSYVDYTIESASGVWTVNASRNKENTFLQCRGKKGAYIKTPAFDKDIKSVTLHFTDQKSVYANNTYCAFPATWTVPTEDAAYPEDGNVGKAVTDGSYSLTIPVAEGNKQVYVSIIGTYAYYIDHIEVAF